METKGSKRGKEREIERSKNKLDFDFKAYFSPRTVACAMKSEMEGIESIKEEWKNGS